MPEPATNIATNMAKEAIDNNPDVVAGKAIVGFVSPELANKMNGETITNIGTDIGTNMFAKTNADGYVSKLDKGDKALAKDLGWINYYRNAITEGVSGDNSYFNYFTNMYNKTFNRITDNAVVNTATAVVNNAAADAAQSTAEMLNLVKPGEHVLDLDPEELDKRVAKLNVMMKDPNMQQHISDTASNVLTAAKKPLQDATEQLTALMGDATKDVSEQGALALGNALKIIPVAGNVISALDTIKNVTNVVGVVAKSAGEAVGVANDLKFGTEMGLKKEEIDALIKTANGAPELMTPINEKITLYNETIDNENTKLQKEVDELNTQINNNEISEKGDATLKVSELKTKIQDYEKLKMQLLNVGERVLPKFDQNVGQNVVEGQRTVPSKGGAKKIKTRINANNEVLKRVNKSLKEHFNNGNGNSNKKTRTTRLNKKTGMSKKKRDHVNNTNNTNKANNTNKTYKIRKSNK